MAAGKAWQDMSQACPAWVMLTGIRGYAHKPAKIGMVWPLDDNIVRKFCKTCTPF